MVNSRFAWPACRLVGAVQPRVSSLAVWREAQHHAGGSHEYLRVFSPLHFRRCVDRWRIQWMVLWSIVISLHRARPGAGAGAETARWEPRCSRPCQRCAHWFDRYFHQNNFNSSLTFVMVIDSRSQDDNLMVALLPIMLLWTLLISA